MRLINIEHIMSGAGKKNRGRKDAGLQSIVGHQSFKQMRFNGSDSSQEG